MDKLAQVHQLAVDGENTFKKLDRDGNGYLSDAELKLALSDKSLSAHDKLLCEFLDNNYQALTSIKNNHDPKLGINQTDLRELEFATDSSTPLSWRAQQTVGIDPLTRVTDDMLGGLVGGTLPFLAGVGTTIALESTPVGWLVTAGAALGATAVEGLHLYAEKSEEGHLTRVAQMAKDFNTGNGDK